MKNDPFVNNTEGNPQMFKADASTDDDIDQGYSSDSDAYGGEVYYVDRRPEGQGNQYNRNRSSSAKPPYQRNTYKSNSNYRGNNNQQNNRSNIDNDKRQPYRNQQRNTSSNKYPQNTPRNLTKKSTQQCEVCGTFGHEKHYECWSLPKHILMSRWEKKNPNKADDVVKKHLAKNNPENRARLAQRMIRANVVRASHECEYMFSPDIEDEMDLCSFYTHDTKE